MTAIIFIYIISILYCRYWLGKAYSKNGIWEIIEPAIIDLFFILMPVVNTTCALMLLFINHTKTEETEKKRKNIDWFFNIKK